MIKLIAFLGNYGDKYKKSRHNVAWQFFDSLNININMQNKFNALFSQLPGHNIFILKPLTYMNKSGDAIGECATFYKITSGEVLVIHDELELPFGTVSFKVGGGLGGHNGLRSTKAALGDADFARLRFGISKPAGVDIAQYVLNNFNSDEAQKLPDIFFTAKNILEEAIATDDFTSLVKKYSKIIAPHPN